MSMGVAISVCEGQNEVEELLNEADAGLYEAKENGRNRIEHFAPPPRRPHPDRRARAKRFFNWTAG